jgi:hypothetical protein
VQKDDDKAEMKQVTTAIAAGRSAAHGDDMRQRRGRRAWRGSGGPDAVNFLRHIVRTEGSATVAQRVRAACAVLEVGGFLSYETRPTGSLREPKGTDGTGEREGT